MKIKPAFVKNTTSALDNFRIFERMPMGATLLPKYVGKRRIYFTSRIVFLSFHVDKRTMFLRRYDKKISATHQLKPPRLKMSRSTLAQVFLRRLMQCWQMSYIQLANYVVI